MKTSVFSIHWAWELTKWNFGHGAHFKTQKIFSFRVRFFYPVYEKTKNTQLKESKYQRALASLYLRAFTLSINPSNSAVDVVLGNYILFNFCRSKLSWCKSERAAASRALRLPLELAVGNIYDFSSHS